MRLRKPHTLLGWMLWILPVILGIWVWGVHALAVDVRNFLIANGVKGL